MALAAANKEGGAHVDGVPEVRYDEIERGPGFGIDVMPPGKTMVISVNATNGCAATLRQMAWELLHSPDLMRLATRGKIWDFATHSASTWDDRLRRGPYVTGRA